MKLPWIRTVNNVSAELESTEEELKAIGAKPRRPKPIKVIITIAALAVVAGSLGTAAYFYTENQRLIATQNPATELEMILSSIAKVFELPQGETPTLATVTDREKLSGQEFFSRAENGDKVLLYEESKKAILYRPSTGKIINVAPINVSNSETTPPASSEVAGVETTVEPVSSEESLDLVIPEVPARVALLNGTTKKGLTGEFEKGEALSDTDSYEVVAKENAARNDYETTIIVDLTNDQAVRAKALAEKLGVEVSSSAPEGEVAPSDTDILVILGADQL